MDNIFEQNSRVKRVVCIYWKIARKGWDKVVATSPFKHGEVNFQKSQVCLFVPKKNVTESVSWILSQHKKWGISKLTKSGESRLLLPTPKALRPSFLSRHNLRKSKLGIIFNVRLENKSIPPKEEELDFIKIYKVLDERLNKFRSEIGLRQQLKRNLWLSA
jgi:hypothetical protein